MELSSRVQGGLHPRCASWGNALASLSQSSSGMEEARADPLGCWTASPPPTGWAGRLSAVPVSQPPQTGRAGGSLTGVPSGALPGRPTIVCPHLPPSGLTRVPGLLSIHREDRPPGSDFGFRERLLGSCAFTLWSHRGEKQANKQPPASCALPCTWPRCPRSRSLLQADSDPEKLDLQEDSFRRPPGPRRRLRQRPSHPLIAPAPRRPRVWLGHVSCRDLLRTHSALLCSSTSFWPMFPGPSIERRPPGGHIWPLIRAIPSIRAPEPGAPASFFV